MKIQLTIDGRARELEVQPGEKAQAVLKRAGVSGVRNGCSGEGSCGACAIVLDDKVVNSCLLLAPQLDGCDVRTVASVTPGPHEISPVQSAVIDSGGVQCGYCTPSVVLAIQDLLDRVEDPSREEIKDALSGIFCRCTGYEQIIESVPLAKKRREDPDFEGEIAPIFRENLRHIGRQKRKVDGAQLARGDKGYVEDMVGPDACHLKMLRSPHAHAYIKSIDTSAAEAMEGVVLVVTHKNCPDVYYNQAGQGFPEPSPYDRKMFGEKVRHVGDRVAVVMAESEEIAKAALAKIVVEYEVLEPVLTYEDAVAEGAPIVQNGVVEYVVGAPAGLDNSGADPRDGKIIYQFPIHGDPHKNLAASVSGGIGDIDKGFAEADVIVERTYDSSQVQCTPLEPHIVYARMFAGRLVVHAATQVPWHLRRIFAHILGIPENKIRVIKERIGGGFGSKQDMVHEEVAAYCTWVTGRPALFRFSREEDFIASRTRHPMRVKVKLGAKKDGKLVAMEMNVLANTGPYGAHCLTVPMNACSKALPLFICENVKFDVKVYYSNIPPAGAYQGYGAPQGSFGMQVAAAELAKELGMDHLAFVEKNRVQEGSWLEILRCLGEGRPGQPETVTTCGLEEALKKGRERIAWGTKEVADDPDVKVGKGVAIIQQGSGLPGLDASNSTVTMFADGTFMLLTGGTDLGTGLDTVSTKMVAEILKVPMEAVSILSSDTDTTPFDVGAYASSGTFYSGGSALNAAKGLRDEILDVASEMLGEFKDQLTIEFPGVVVGRTGSVTYQQMARQTQSGSGRGQLTHTANFTAEKPGFPYAAHFAKVSVNVRTGVVKIDSYYAFHDSGTPINPEMAVGQMYGGALKTIGHSLFEEMIVDKNGVCLNPNFLDYLIPMSGDLPDDFHAELIDTDEPYGPYGAKSISEIACNGAAPAIATAIHDATGVWLRRWPFTPEAVLKALGKI
jgi:putative selenate reductase molybdopterin-binding subunit